MPLFADRYEILDELGKGGHGRVYRAHDKNQNQLVALKLFGAGATPMFAFREAQALTALQGDHILHVRNANVWQDVPYLATAVAGRGSATDCTPPGLGLPPDLVVVWIQHLLRGLMVCHDSGLLHRDVKPQNLFIERDDLALLGDFGIVEQIDSSGKCTRHGTPRYTAPEGYTTGELSVASDIYSAGLTAWYLLTGQRTFDGVDDADLEHAIVAGIRTRLRDIAPHVPRSVAHVVERAMARDPSDRFARAMDMDTALSDTRRINTVWQRVEPPPGAAMQWRAPGRGLEVTVTELSARSMRISTTRMSTGNRLRDHCDELASNRLMVRLRQVFDSL